MLDIAQHASLVVGVLDLLHLDDLSLLEHLDGIEPLVMLRLDQMNSPEATSTEGPQNIEVAQRVLALGDARLRAIAGLLLVLLVRGLLHGLSSRLLLPRGLHRGLRQSLLLLLLDEGGSSAGAGRLDRSRVYRIGRMRAGVVRVGVGVGRAVMLGRIDEVADTREVLRIVGIGRARRVRGREDVDGIHLLPFGLGGRRLMRRGRGIWVGLSLRLGRGAC